MIKALWRRMTALDRLIVAVLLVLTAASFSLLGQRPAGAWVVVERDGRLLFRAPLDEDRSVYLPGPLGESRLQILDGRARILDSPCPHKVCLGMGGVFRQGQLIACVPNRLIVHIEGEKEQGSPDYDLLSH
jgi:hypothetical protein